MNHKKDWVNYDDYLPISTASDSNQFASIDDITANGGIVSKPKSQNTIYLTFCLGTDLGYTQMVLDVLKAKNVKAAFFVVGYEYLLTNSNVKYIKRIVNDGHILGSHGYTHYYTNKFSEVRLLNEHIANDTIFSIALGYEYKAKYYRPPFGAVYMRDLYLCKKLGKTLVRYTYAVDDLLDEVNYTGTLEQGRSRVLTQLKAGLSNGSIYYLHCSQYTAPILAEFIDYARSKGYQILNIDE